MPVRYDGQSLVPAPLVDISKEFIRADDGVILHPDYTITLTGTIVNVGEDLDSPGVENETFGDMADIQAEQIRIRTIFDVDGGRLEIEAPGGGSAHTLDAFCTVQSINFERSTWTTRCNYTIVLKTNKIEDDDTISTQLSAYNENWSFSENQDGTTAVSHRLVAQGLPIYDGPNSLSTDPLIQAKNWCNDRKITINTDGALTYSNSDFSLTSTITNIGSGNENFWNYALVENIGPTEYSWEINESFLYDPSGVAREIFTASRNINPEDSRKYTVSINGTVFGNAENQRNLNLRNSRAETFFNDNVEPNLATRALQYIPSGFTINPGADSRQVNYQLDEGVLSYSYTFAAVKGFLFSDAIEEQINVVDNGPTDVFAQIPVPGRANGPVVQYMNTSTLPERTLNISLLFPPESGLINSSTLASLYEGKPDTDSIVDLLKPNVGFYYTTQNNEEWNPIRRRYNRNITWVIQREGASVTGVPSTLSNPDD